MALNAWTSFSMYHARDAGRGSTYELSVTDQPGGINFCEHLTFRVEPGESHVHFVGLCDLTTSQGASSQGRNRNQTRRQETREVVDGDKLSIAAGKVRERSWGLCVLRVFRNEQGGSSDKHRNKRHSAGLNLPLSFIYTYASLPSNQFLGPPAVGDQHVWTVYYLKLLGALTLKVWVGSDLARN